jgi:hypothetical protein
MGMLSKYVWCKAMVIAKASTDDEDDPHSG